MANVSLNEPCMGKPHTLDQQCRLSGEVEVLYLTAVALIVAKQRGD